MARTLPAGRYPVRRRLPRWALALAVGLALVVVGAFVLLARTDAGFGVSYGTSGFTTSPTGVSVTFEVDKKASATAECTLTAQARDNGTVGTRTVRVGPRRTSHVTLTAVIPTSRRAVTGNVTTCRLLG